MKKLEKIKNVKMEAFERAVNTYETIIEAFSRPDKAITGENLSVYNELLEWGFIDKYDIFSSDNKWLYVTVIAMIFNHEEKLLEKNKSAIGNTKWEKIQSTLKKFDKYNVNKNTK